MPWNDTRNSKTDTKVKQAPVGTGMSHARNSRWGMLLHVNEPGIYGGQNKIGVHVYHVGIAIYTNPAQIANGHLANGRLANGRLAMIMIIC